MSDLSRVTLSGVVCTELNLSQGDKYTMVYFRLAQNKYKDESQFISVKAWGDLAERMSKYVKKGSYILLWGRLDVETYQEKEKFSVVAEGFEFARASKPKVDSETVEQEEAQTNNEIEEEVPF